MKKLLLAAAVALLYVLHQDFWNWRTARLNIPSLGIHGVMPFGFLPVGLGQRILRTETASLVAVALLQHRFGDLG